MPHKQQTKEAKHAYYLAHEGLLYARRGPVQTREQRREYGRQWRLAHLEQERARDRARYDTDRYRERRPPKTRLRWHPSVCWIESCPEPRKVSKSGRTTYQYCSEHQKAHQNAQARGWDRAHPEAVAAMQARWAKTHPEAMAACQVRRRVARLGLPPFTTLDPWPLDWCVIHAGPIVGKTHKDHDPSLVWLAAHPEYAGPRLLGPTCAFCNQSAHAHGPTWSLLAKDAA